ncbi:MAG: rRNA maturation RNase YbeY [Phaeodactylibacter sp.]|nr:rRNA maturation RNase YbeY [Phaeodactylibacter sp.]
MSNTLEEWLMEDETPSISFQSEDIEFEVPNPGLLSEWIKSVIEQEGCNLQHACYIFCSDEYLLQLNKEYLNHNTYTDIITFPYTEPPLIEGDMFISVDRVKDNARQYGVPFEQELHRVIIHGIFHLCGYSDKSAEEKTRMRQKEEEALKLLPE